MRVSNFILTEPLLLESFPPGLRCRAKLFAGLLLLVALRFAVEPHAWGGGGQHVTAQDPTIAMSVACTTRLSVGHVRSFRPYDSLFRLRRSSVSDTLARYVMRTMVHAIPSSSSGGIPSFELRDGASMPVLGLGTYRMTPGTETENAVNWALKMGYRMVDTAMLYQNEHSVGKAIYRSGIPREQIFIATKLWLSDHGYERAMNACRKSIQDLGVDYLDLYLIHSPGAGLLLQTWDALLELQRVGLVKHIGVSNFGINHLEALESYGRPLPVVNQLEMHPLILHERQALVDWCKAKGILVQAYGPMLSGRREFLMDSALMKLAETKRKTPTQVLLRWAFQMGFQVIPKSVREHRIQENMEIFDFDLNTDEVSQVSSMKGALREYWNPLSTPVDIGETHHWRPP